MLCYLAIRNNALIFVVVFFQREVEALRKEIENLKKKAEESTEK